jgi:putative phosphoribosyl transferase
VTNPSNVDMPFRDRKEAGRALGQALLAHRRWDNPLVLALPRGGVPVAFEVAQALSAPLDILVVRKIGHPLHEEFAIGAIASGGVAVMNPRTQDYLGDVSKADVERIMARERAELQRRERLYRGGSPALDLRDRETIVVDDGLATGATMQAAVQALRQLHPASITVAVPVAARESCEALARAADHVVCVRTPEPFRAVGLWYADFPQTSDDEVRELLEAAQHHPAT